ncbi:hypothetical protein ACQX6A_00165 [Salmonella enterica]|uniref:hypothetical protein n=1 Tax=Salmonella enterica TaxID=28901 RepID=UPI001274854D|nr:hypothetical protein [Salmonella enterica]EBW6193561.1 hypothetical protein [Salmonella enterica subsp. enterica serovar Agbeni]EEI6240575.1 hypothetical protein [Salmonella enterica subsp. enterica serovar Tudu]EGC2272785.1 hypothetical protein [Salmonella enterica subsp. enterica serovar Agbeni]EGL2187054.1 hypothetical protein [Salmonella enterica subsp. enterica serovar Agbeni]
MAPIYCDPKIIATSGILTDSGVLSFSGIIIPAEDKARYQPIADTVGCLALLFGQGKSYQNISYGDIVHMPTTTYWKYWYCCLSVDGNVSFDAQQIQPTGSWKACFSTGKSVVNHVGVWQKVKNAD